MTKQNNDTLTTAQLKKLTVAKLLPVLNKARKGASEKRLAKWTSSKGALIEAIEAYAVSDVANTDAQADDDNTMSVAELAREMDVNPKVARGKLRRRGIFATNGSHVRFARDSETFKQYAAIIAPKVVVVDNG